MSSVTGQLFGARYLGERQVIHALTPEFASVLEGLQHLSKGEIDHVTCVVSSKRWVFKFTDDRNVGTTYFYDHSKDGKRHSTAVAFYALRLIVII